ncbi:MAG: serine hydrolase, partial [Aggregatilineales bacterium]
MTISGLGTRRRARRIPWLALVSGGFLLAALILLAAQLARFASAHDVLQTDITVGGVPVGGLPLSEAVKRWETIYAQPVEVDYGVSPILLYPAQVGFFIKSDQLQSQVESRAAGTNNYWTDFWNYLWQRPATPIDIPLAADYQTAKLRDFLNDVAARYEVHASGAHFDLSTMTFGSGANGAHIDIEAAILLIDNALHSPTKRKVTLPLKSEGSSGANMQTLHDAIVTYLQNIDYLGNKGLSFNGPATVGAVAVIDLKNGGEMMINPDTAFSALSTIKIPIMLTRFSKLVLDPDKDTKWLMAASILCSSNSASNFLIQESGTGTNDQNGFRTGLQAVMDTMQILGAKNTYINAPLYVGVKTLEYSFPAPKTNPDKQFNANPDPFSQTTANDMATLLKEL